MTYKLLVSGGRDFDDVDFIVDYLMRIHKSKNITTIISGGARGVDTIAEYWADELGIEKDIYEVTDSEWNKFGKRAGILRNKRMLDEAEPDGVFCFPGGNGTANMYEICHDIPWLEVWQSKNVYFRKEDKRHWFMSNFAKKFDFADPSTGEWWMTSEHYYQAHKTPIETERSMVQNTSSPAEARTAGRMINSYDDWQDRKIDVMRRALKLKFNPGSEAAELLVATGWDYLVEYAPWGDVFWGVDKNHMGKNWLGRLLMERRDELVN